jgi:hypothetical protein
MLRKVAESGASEPVSVLLFRERPLGQCQRSLLVKTEGTPCDRVEIIRSEYLELPGLSLTKIQAQRLWGLDQATCDCPGARIGKVPAKNGLERYVRPEFNS